MIQFKCGNCSAVLQSPSSMLGKEETCPECGHICIVSLPGESEQAAEVSPSGESEQISDVSPTGSRRGLYIALGVAVIVLAIGVAVVFLWPKGNPSSGGGGVILPRSGGASGSRPTNLRECLADERFFNAETVEVFLTLAKDHPEAFAGEVYVTGRTVDVGTQDMFAGFSILATWKRLSGFRGSRQASLSKTGGEKTLHAQAGTLPEPLLRQEVTATGIMEILGPSTGIRNIDWVGEVKTYYDGAIGFVGTAVWIDGPKFIAAAKK